MTIRKRLTSKARIAITAGLVALIALGSSVVATSASADPVQFSPIYSSSSWMNLGVRDGSTAAGADIIQWWSDNNADQRWSVYHYNTDPTNTGRLVNEGSGMCITTDGVPGDPVRQQVCDRTNGSHQEWLISYSWIYSGATFYNPVTGLMLDVQGDSYWGGAEIDTWYPTGQVNQVFDQVV